MIFDRDEIKPWDEKTFRRPETAGVGDNPEADKERPGPRRDRVGTLSRGTGRGRCKRRDRNPAQRPASGVRRGSEKRETRPPQGPGWMRSI